jgi:bla regulator protein blaR1
MARQSSRPAGKDHEEPISGCRGPRARFVPKAGATSVAIPTIIAIVYAAAIRAQDAADWQAKAGSRMAFEVASIRLSQGASVSSNVALTPWDDYTATNGRLRADATLSEYIQFAYKLWSTGIQGRELSRLPKWASTDRYIIEARAAMADVSKDQMRLMMQSLLAERFQLAAHFEGREVPVFELKLAQPAKRGPKLVLHAGGPPCDKPGASSGEGRLPGFPVDCHSLTALDKPDGMIVLGSRDVTMDVLAGALSMLEPQVGRPVLDRTGLTQRFDFTIEWERPPRAPGPDAPPPAPLGPTLIEAVHDQLGLKLEPSKASLAVLVIDKVERPSAN